MTSTGLIERQAIGRTGSIGALYNIRTDQFVMGNLFKTELPKSMIKTTDNANVSYWLDFHNSQKETFNNLNVEASLKLGLFAGLLKVEGSAKYLKQTKTDSKTVRATFLYKMKTKQEDLLVSNERLHEYFSAYAFENPDVTHVVIGIKWGANVAATFERTVEKNEDVQRIEGTLSVAFTKPMFSISGEGKLNYNDEEKKDMESLKISFSGDVLIKDCPQTIDQVMKVYRDVPSLVETLNDGKGQQLTFILCSLKQIAEMTKFERKITRMVKEVSESVVNRIENIFEQLNEERRRLNDFLDDIKPWKEFLPRPWFNIIKEKLTDFDAEELHLKRQLAEILIAIRSGITEELKMVELIDHFNEHPCSPTSIEKFLHDNRRISRKITTLKRISPEQKHLLTTITSVEDFIQDFYDNDLYLLHICDQWQTNDEDNSYRQMRYFNSLKKLEEESGNDKAKFRVIDYDLHGHLKNKLTESVIFHVTRATIISRDFFRDSFHNLSRKQIELILKESSNITEKWLVDRHKQFIKDYPNGELSAGDFVREFRKLFPRGNPDKFCDLAFPTLDKNKNGKIDFSGFMTAGALTHAGNVRIRLHLAFLVCDHDASGTISAEKIVKFIEVIGELHGGPAVVSTSAAKSLAEQILYICGKKKDELVTEDEFLRCCKRSKKITMAFLPDMKISSESKLSNGRWKQQGMTIAGGNGQGSRWNQLSQPRSLFIDDQQTIYIADCSNDRIVELRSHTTRVRFFANGNGKGNNMNQLNGPTDVMIDDENDSLIIADRDNRRVMQWSRQNHTEGEVRIPHIHCSRLAMGNTGSLYVSDWKKNEVRRWRKGEKGDGTVVAGGNGVGAHRNQLNHPTFIFIDDDGALYVSDTNNHRVVKWTKRAREGIVVAGGNGQGNSLKQLSSPQGVVVDHLGQIYVADCGNHRVMRWSKDAVEGRIIVGRTGEGAQANQFNHPKGLAIDQKGNLYVVDSNNHRVQKFEME